MDDIVLTIDLSSDEADKIIGVLADLASSQIDAVAQPIIGEFCRAMSDFAAAADLLYNLAVARSGDVSALLDLKGYEGRRPFTSKAIVEVVNATLCNTEDYEEVRLWGNVGAIWLMALSKNQPDHAWTSVVSKLDTGVLGKIFEGISYAEEDPLPQLAIDQSEAVSVLLGNLLLDRDFPVEGLASEFSAEMFGDLFERFAKTRGVKEAIDLFFGYSFPEIQYREMAFDGLSKSQLKNTLLGLTSGASRNYREVMNIAEDEIEARALYVDVMGVARIISLAPPDIQPSLLGLYSKEFQEELRSLF